MTKHSAGILLYRRAKPGIEFLLVHPGGPFWAKKDEHAWSIPKGETEEDGEAGEIGKAGATSILEKTARREFEEEIGMKYEGKLTPLPPVKASGKVIHAFLGEGDFDVSTLRSNLFEMEWPPKSGKMQSFPEVDKAEWFDAGTAKEKLHKGQIAIIDLSLTALDDG